MATTSWQGILQASLATVMQTSPTGLSQHWNGNGPDGKINNAVQILQDAAVVGGRWSRISRIRRRRRIHIPQSLQRRPVHGRRRMRDASAAKA